MVAKKSGSPGLASETACTPRDNYSTKMPNFFKLLKGRVHTTAFTPKNQSKFSEKSMKNQWKLSVTTAKLFCLCLSSWSTQPKSKCKIIDFSLKNQRKTRVWTRPNKSQGKFKLLTIVLGSPYTERFFENLLGNFPEQNLEKSLSVRAALCPKIFDFKILAHLLSSILYNCGTDLSEMQYFRLKCRPWCWYNEKIITKPGMHAQITQPSDLGFRICAAARKKVLRFLFNDEARSTKGDKVG